MPRLLPAGLFGRLRAQMLILLTVSICALDLVMLWGVDYINDAEVTRALSQAQRIAADSDPRLDRGVPANLFIAHVNSSGGLIAQSTPSGTDDVPAVGDVHGAVSTDPEHPSEVEAPGGTTYRMVRISPSAGAPLGGLDEAGPGDGSIVIGYPMMDVERNRRRLLLLQLVTGGLVLGAAALVSGGFVRSGLRPLRRIGRTAEAIAHGRTEARVEIDGRDPELREVVHGINHAFDARQASENRMRDFVADASHELRTPLASVRGWADLYREGGIADWDGVDAAMRTIFEEAGRMEELVEDMLLLARFDARPDVETVETVALDSLLEEVVAAVGALHLDHDFRCLPVARSVQVRADRAALRRALANLLTNAGRHTPAGTRVVISGVVRERDVEVYVEDDGPGLSPKDREQAFDRFWRGDRSRGRRAGTRGGTGLGLAISRSILQAAGGDLRLAESVQGGMSAVVSLRRAPDV
jgi:two-component system, OmpR family, sensor kinase